jgi:hypothetical protein
MLERNGQLLTAEVRGSDTATLGEAAWRALGAAR